MYIEIDAHISVVALSEQVDVYTVLNENYIKVNDEDQLIELFNTGAQFFIKQELYDKIKELTEFITKSFNIIEY